MPDYIIVREDDHIEHHGTKGQKWGVRRYQNADGSLTAEGREHYGINKRMDNQFKRESRKLAKLNERADIDAQTQKWHKYNKRAAVGAAVGAAGAALATGGTNALMNRLTRIGNEKADAAWNNYTKTMNDAGKYYDNNVGVIMKSQYMTPESKANAIGRESALYGAQMRGAVDKYNDAKNESLSNMNKAFYITRHGGTAIAAAGLGFAAYNKIKASQAKKRVSEVGHTKAVADAKAQLKKMEQMFANTPYEQFIKDMKKAG